jgi:hypothetical protein
MDLVSQSILLQLEVFAADNNIRRSVLSCASNIKGDLLTGNFSEVTKVFAPLASPTILPYVFTGSAGNKLTVLRSIGGSLSIKLTKGLEVINFILNDNLFVFPSFCDTIEIKNLSTTNVKLHLIQI